MKNIIIQCALTLMLSTTFYEITSAQGGLIPWYLTGNNVINQADYLGANNVSSFPVRFRHYVPANLGRFEWYTEAGGQQQERMRLTNGGWLGINTSALLNGNPQMMLHVNNGGILSTGTEGANPNLGSGTRFMWVPSSASLRAAEANGLRSA
jgi:hypothetical protein